MARPRIFLSSTFYDLKFVRSELERFIREMGYDSVRNERGQVPYGVQVSLEDYCYREISKVNILISIIGGKFGSASIIDSNYSISNMEAKQAVEQNKQLYIFVESGVYAEYQTYLKNPTLEIQFAYVDDKRIFKFIEEMHKLPINNQIVPFSDVDDIVSHLREQWAGLFERYLQDESQEQMRQMVERMSATSQTLGGIVKLLGEMTATKENSDQSATREFVDAITLRNHPIFVEIKAKLRIAYRVFFTNKSEFEIWLKSSRGGSEIELGIEQDFYEYKFSIRADEFYMDIAKQLFGPDDTLLPMLPGDWRDDYLRVYAVLDKSLAAKCLTQNAGFDFRLLRGYG